MYCIVRKNRGLIPQKLSNGLTYEKLKLTLSLIVFT